MAKTIEEPKRSEDRLTCHMVDAGAKSKNWSTLGRKRSALEGHHPALQRRRNAQAAGHPDHRLHLCQNRRQTPVAPHQHRRLCAALGALTGNQAVQQVEAGLKAIYLSGWQVAADANLAGEMYPDQSLYPANSVPAVVRASTMPCAAPIRSRCWTARAKRDPTGSPPSWPTPKPDSAAPQRLRTDETDDRCRRRRGPLRRPAGSRQKVRPHGRQGAGADQ
jgi:hypothetical protein